MLHLPNALKSILRDFFWRLSDIVSDIAISLSDVYYVEPDFLTQHTMCKSCGKEYIHITGYEDTGNCPSCSEWYISNIELLERVIDRINEANKAGQTPYPMWGHEMADYLLTVKDRMEERNAPSRMG